MKFSRYTAPLLAAAALAALAACGGGGYSAPTVTASPVTTPTPKVTPAAVATSVPLSPTALVNQPVATAVPAPLGYLTSVSVPLVNAPAHTTIQISSSISAPSSLPGLQSARRAPQGLRPMSGGSFNTIFYDSIVPSQTITVAGNVSFSQDFPSGGLNATGAYYLAYYDSSQPSPAWATIAGPVTPSGSNLTFSGVVPPSTLMAGKLYGFAIFTLAAPSATPPPASQTLAYLADASGGTGIEEVTAAGTLVKTLSIQTTIIGLDDAANAYSLFYPPAPSPSPGASSSPSPPPPVLAEYPAGSSTAAGSYAPTSQRVSWLNTAGSGEVVVEGFNSGSSLTQVFDEWDPGKTGAPSRTITLPATSTVPSLDVAHDGTLYVPSYPNGTLEYLVYPPGSTTASRTITESIVPVAQQSSFVPNYMAIGPDGTLYVTEYSFNVGDPLAGLYIYPPNGPEKFVATKSDSQGAGPQGVDVDASGNIYVGNNNAGWNNTGVVADTLHDIQEFSPMGASVLRDFTGSFDPYPVTVGADGTLFFSGWDIAAHTSNGSTYSVAAKSTAPTLIAPFAVNNILLYDGYREQNPMSHGRRPLSTSGSTSSRAGGQALEYFLAHRHR